MKKTRYLNLNRYEIVKDKALADIVIIPFDENGSQPAPIMLKKKVSSDHAYLENVEGAVWDQSVRISTQGTQEEYNKRVDWWFDGMSPQYKEQIVAIAKNAIDRGFDLKGQVAQIRMWLKNVSKNKRKTYLSQFFTNCINKDVYKFLRFNK